MAAMFLRWVLLVLLRKQLGTVPVLRVESLSTLCGPLGSRDEVVS